VNPWPNVYKNIDGNLYAFVFIVKQPEAAVLPYKEYGTTDCKYQTLTEADSLQLSRTLVHALDNTYHWFVP
jgi:hypothetical protein